MDVQQQAVQRPADQFGVGPVWERAEVGVVVFPAVDPAVQQLLIAVLLISVAAATDNAGLPGAALGLPAWSVAAACPGQVWKRESRPSAFCAAACSPASGRSRSAASACACAATARSGQF